MSWSCDGVSSYLERMLVAINSFLSLFLFRITRKKQLAVVAILSIVLCETPARGQAASEIPNIPQQPTTSGTLGRVDQAALTEITAHLTAVGAVAWTGMQGTGQIVYGAKDPTSYNATFSTMGTDQYRLDAQTNKGEMSIRIRGDVGKIQGGGGPATAIPVETALVGIFPFALVRGAHFPGPTTSLIDHGLITEGGAELHRITVEFGSVGRDPVTKSRRTVAIDLYFDPTSHLLAKSASSSFVAEGHSAKFLRVVAYSDYRQVGTSMVPFRYTESMDGDQYWVLQLSDVQLSPALPATYFQF